MQMDPDGLSAKCCIPVNDAARDAVPVADEMDADMFGRAACARNVQALQRHVNDSAAEIQCCHRQTMRGPMFDNAALGGAAFAMRFWEKGASII